MSGGRSDDDVTAQPPLGTNQHLTEHLAAIRHVEAAIEAFIRGDFDICITLAGAAEGMFERRKGSDLHTVMMSDPRAKEFGVKDVNSSANMVRDWLKHDNPRHPASIEIAPFEAAVMLVRAMTKLDGWTTKMDAIKPAIYEVIVGEPISTPSPLLTPEGASAYGSAAMRDKTNITENLTSNVSNN
ncbi:hypothetical protein AB4099_03220 [Bosea sp. 2KB_26]|uniref:hypothetical protein n=1 Tax=Bosea sp. 2KB_26 TaxID=3237475 RepID=UPI003F935FB1